MYNSMMIILVKNCFMWTAVKKKREVNISGVWLWRMINLANNDCFTNEETASECLETVKFIFPDGYNYYISEFIPVETKFKTLFRVDITNKED